MRCFIAIDFSSKEVHRVLEELKAIPGVKTVEPQNLHVTLKFLGEIPEEKAEKIHEAMQSTFSSFKQFDVSMQGVGAFPSINYVRVVWVGFKEGREKLIAMQRALDENLVNLGFSQEKKFDPHLTIGRVKSAEGKEELREFISRHCSAEFGSIVVDKVELKKSMLTPKGPIYSGVGVVELL